MPVVRLLRTLVVLPLMAFAILAAATALAPPTDASAATTSATAPSASRQQKVLRATSVALRQIGDPYRYGAEGPRSFDCSGLVTYSYQKAGIKLPRTSSAQARRAHRIPKSKLRRGDLMFFRDGGGVYHVAMFLKRTKGHVVMVHSPGSGQRVRRDRPWTSSWFAGTMR
jgi:cell wall-associated NlpC family hydrolase